MFDKSGPARHKNEVNVSLTLAGQPAFEAVIFLTLGERIIDLLNDDRRFIPARNKTGEMLFLAKTSIVSLIEQERAEEKTQEAPHKDEPRKTNFDPYKVLRINPAANLDAIRSAYKERIKAVHPDTIAALDLDEDLSRAALLAAQKVNYAYKVIMQERENETLRGEQVG